MLLKNIRHRFKNFKNNNCKIKYNFTIIYKNNEYNEWIECK